ncbi:MAG: carbohydrate porin [Gammaproteobacteria bacterium]|jgi:porin|nr:carbohydrate porin [Gammaproteobacteria bacterium]
MNNTRLRRMAVALWGLLGYSSAFAEGSGEVEFTGLMAAMGQHQSLSDTNAGGDTANGAYVFQPEVMVKPTDADEFAVKFGFAANNGLNGYSPFGVAPWAADLEDDVRNINGRNRDYLLTAWYKHEFEFNESNQLDVYFGLIDGTDFLDENVYSNDEFTQFMNQALVNGPNFFAPSYDSGLAVAWQRHSIKIHAVAMAVGENEAGNAYNYFGAELEYHINTGLGEGNYRATMVNTSADFEDPTGQGGKRHNGIIFSFDQQLGQAFGAFIRFGWQNDEAAIEYENIASGGIDINGGLWSRPHDNIGFGFAHVNGGNLDMEHTLVAEAYYRFVATGILALTLDLQYISENYREPNAGTVEGFIPGLRLVAGF